MLPMEKSVEGLLIHVQNKWEGRNKLQSNEYDFIYFINPEWY